jgi:hypothetical protein
MKVFLGGTCNNTTWRDELIPLLEENNIDYFNPVVKDWNQAAQDEEQWQKEVECDVHLYVITIEMAGVFSIAEIIDSAHEEHKTTIMVVAQEGFTDAQLKSLQAVANMVMDHGQHVSWQKEQNVEQTLTALRLAVS